MNEVFGTDLRYESLSAKAYRQQRVDGLSIWARSSRAYQGIRNGAMDVPSDYRKAAGRDHISLLEAIKHFQAQALS